MVPIVRDNQKIVLNQKIVFNRAIVLNQETGAVGGGRYVEVEPPQPSEADRNASDPTKKCKAVDGKILLCLHEYKDYWPNLWLSVTSDPDCAGEIWLKKIVPALREITLSTETSKGSGIRSSIKKKDAAVVYHSLTLAYLLHCVLSPNNISGSQLGRDGATLRWLTPEEVVYWPMPTGTSPLPPVS